MPRRRISEFNKGLRKPGSSMIRQRRNYRAARVHFVSQSRCQFRVFRYIDIDAGAKADETEPLAPREAVAFANVAENAPGDEPRDLHADHVGAPGRSQPQCVAL